MSIQLAPQSIDACPPAAASVKAPNLLQRTAGRSLGPDLARAGAALLVVYLHACVPYLQQPMPGLVWPVEDDPCALVSALFWSIELFIMPLFLVLAGYFAFRTWTGGGGAKLIASRARRLLLPLIAASVVLLPLGYYLWIVGWVIEERVAADRLWKLRLPATAREHLIGSAHLWFLQYVFLYCVALAAALAALRRLIEVTSSETNRSPGAAKWTQLVLAGRNGRLVAMIALPLVGCIVLAIAPQVVYGFQHAFLPVASKWLYSGTFFFGGVAIAFYDPCWGAIDRNLSRLLLCGALCGGAGVTLGQWAIGRSDASSLAFDVGLANRVLLAAVTVAAAWSAALGLIGGAHRLAAALAGRPRIAAAISYVAAAGFWIYLIHHPLVALIHIDLKLLAPGLSPLAKSLVASGIATGLSLASYCLVARRGRGTSAVATDAAGGVPDAASAAASLGSVLAGPQAAPSSGALHRRAA